MTPAPEPLLEIGTCSSCSQGRVGIARSLLNRGLFLVCEECFTEWPDPASFLSRKNASFEAFGRFEYAGRDEILNHPWKPFILNTADIDPSDPDLNPGLPE